MIVIDTSALMAVLLNEARSAECVTALAGGDKRLISAGTLTEALIVAARLGLRSEMIQFIDDLRAEIISVTVAFAHLSADAYQRWGKGFHPAALNYGDCFAYALAKEQNCPLLYIGNDFSQTDVRSALS